VLENVSLEDALSFLLSRTEPLNRTVRAPLGRALGLVSAEKVLASVDNPPFDRSPLDGFALKSSDSANASSQNPLKLKIVATVYAGMAFDRPIAPGEAVKIMTGAPMPEGSDCVIAKEMTEESGGLVEIRSPLAPFENYVFKGEDVKKGAVFIEEGMRLDHARLGMLAAMGYPKILVRPATVASLASVGDELASPGERLGPGMIYNSNDVMLGARLAEFGLDVRPMSAIKDDPAVAAEALAVMAAEADVILTTGSVSVGDKDVMPDALKLLGAEIEISRLAFKPGHAFMCALYKGKRIFCLSGNPFAALATMELVARPVLAKLARQERLLTRRGRAEILDAFPGGRGRTRRFLRASLIEREGSLPAVALPEGHSSGRLFSLAGCDCLVDLAAGAPNPSPGDVVEVVKLGLPV
jgi:molybdopterin molybdotransferase